MTPPSGLYSLAKVGALTFFGAFLGALTMSTMPTTLDGWKAMVMPALGAAIAAELVFLRTTVATMLTGTTVSQTTTTANIRGDMGVRMLEQLLALGNAYNAAVALPTTDASRESQVWVSTHSSLLVECIQSLSGVDPIRLKLVNGETVIDSGR